MEILSFFVRYGMIIVNVSVIKIRFEYIRIYDCENSK